MTRPNLRPIPDSEPEPAQAEVLPVPRPASTPVRRSSHVLATVPKPVLTAGGVALGAVVLGLLQRLGEWNRDRKLERRRRQAGSPFIAIVTEKIQIDLRSKKR